MGIQIKQNEDYYTVKKLENGDITNFLLKLKTKKSNSQGTLSSNN